MPKSHLSLRDFVRFSFAVTLVGLFVFCITKMAEVAIATKQIWPAATFALPATAIGTYFRWPMIWISTPAERKFFDRSRLFYRMRRGGKEE